METAVTVTAERRRTGRLRSVEEHGIVASRLRPGTPTVILDISSGGALVETEYRLLPGAAVELHMKTTEETAVVRGRVLRSAVARLGPHPVRYRGAIGFDGDVTWMATEHGGGYRLPPHETRSGRPGRASATPQIL